VTLVLSLLGRNTMWVVVDRRLSYGENGPPPRDSATKVMRLQTDDGVGLLAYAGLGASAHGTEPSAWMSSTLRGRRLTFEESLGVIAEAATRELPVHLAQIEGSAHSIIVPAYLRGQGARLFSIDNVLDRATGQHRYRFVRWERTKDSQDPGFAITLAGTGGVWLSQKRQKLLWKSSRHSLLHAKRAHDRGKLSDRAVADQLAAINFSAHQAVPETVGPTCVVVWTRRPGAPGDGVNAHQFYSGLDRVTDHGMIPAISNGMDWSALGQVIASEFQRSISEANWPESDGPIDLDDERLNERLAELPSDPDEHLR